MSLKIIEISLDILDLDMPRLSEQLREHIIAWRFTDGKEVSEIAQLAGCSERSIYNVLHMYREYGHMPHPRTQGRPELLTLVM